MSSCSGLPFSCSLLGLPCWQPGLRWAYEVRAPAGADCTQGVPEVTRPIGEWLNAGFVPARGRQVRVIGALENQLVTSRSDCGLPG